jgi:hypothetical protein
MSTTRLTAAAVSLATLAAVGVIGVSTASAATTKFGAKLTNQTQPSNAISATCADSDPTLSAVTPCTRVATTFADVGGLIKAPKSGIVKKIKLIAQKPGTMKPVVVALKNINTQAYTAKGKETAKGPQIKYVSSVQPTSYKVQSFAVNFPVQKGEYLGIVAKRTSMLRCNSGGGKQLLFQPPLKIGNPFNPSDGRDDCVLLIQAVMQ